MVDIQTVLTFILFYAISFLVRCIEISGPTSYWGKQMKKNRQQWLEELKKEVEQLIAKRKAESKVLKPGDRIVFEIRVIPEEPPIVGNVIDGQVMKKLMPLPRDEGFGDHGPRTIWRLSQEDWEKLNQLPFNVNQKTFFDLLRDASNGPIHRQDAIEKGIIFDKKEFTRDFNRVLESLNDYQVGSRSSGAYYKLRNLGGAFYAIMKHGYR